MQSVATVDELNDASRHKISEKMHRWDQSLPRRRKDTAKRIEIALQQKGTVGIFNDMEEEELNGHSPIINSGETSINNEYTVQSFFFFACIYFEDILR